MSVAQEKASYAGEVSTSGKLILAGTLAVAIAGFEQKVDLGRIEVPIPALKAGLDFAAKDVKGAKDGANGDACGRKRGAATTSEPASVTPEETPPSPSGPSEPNGGRCAVDAQESNGPPNDEMAVATSLGRMSDTAEKKDRQKTVSGFVGIDDVDWFVLDVADEGWNGNPHVTVRVLEPNVELALYYDCAAGPSSSTCEKGSPNDALLPLPGCRGSEVTLATSCSGINETGKAFIQVRAQDQACHGYALDVLVE